MRVLICLMPHKFITSPYEQWKKKTLTVISGSGKKKVNCHFNFLKFYGIAPFDRKTSSDMFFGVWVSKYCVFTHLDFFGFFCLTYAFFRYGVKLKVTIWKVIKIEVPKKCIWNEGLKHIRFRRNIAQSTRLVEAIPHIFSIFSKLKKFGDLWPKR